MDTNNILRGELSRIETEIQENRNKIETLEVMRTLIKKHLYFSEPSNYNENGMPF